MSQKSHKKKTLLPKLRFPEFKGDGEWSETPLSSLSKRIRRKVGTKKLTPVSITAGLGFVDQTKKFGRRIAGKQYKNYIHIQSGDFVYNKGNSKTFPQGCIYQLKEFEEAAASTAFICFKLNGSCVDHYFQSLFEYNAHGEKLLKFITSGARSDGLLNINPTDFFSIVLPLTPRKEEQQKIADCLSSLDDLLTAHSAKLDALQDHKKGLLQQLFPGTPTSSSAIKKNAGEDTGAPRQTSPALRFPEFEGKWDSESMASLYTFIPTNSFSRDKMNDNAGEIRNIHYGDIHKNIPTLLNLQITSLPRINDSVSLKKFKERSFCKNGDVIFADASEDVDDIGKSIEIVNTGGFQVLSGLHTIHARQKKTRFVVGFAGYLFCTSRIRSQIQRESQGTKVLGISVSRLSTIDVCFPREKREQQKIADCLSALDDLITAQTKQIAALKEHKKGLMQQLFSTGDSV